MAYDIIGDIHGQADKLHALLTHLGYSRRAKVWRHSDPNRKAIFVGDFIDKGPRQIDSVMTVRRMVDAGSALAIMGNHEFNAIAWHTPNPDRSGDFLRPRGNKLGAKNRDQHDAFLREFGNKPGLHRELIDWFLTLPLWIDLPGIRVVHACWHDGYMNELRHHLTRDLRLTRGLMAKASREGWMEFRTVEGLTKGLEIALPEGQMFLDKYGTPRHHIRIRWWDSEATTYRDLAMVSNDLRDRLPGTDVPREAHSPYDNEKPVFFGHYWMTGKPKQLTATIACVDYSAADEGPLVAYRWDGEPQIDDRNFVGVGGSL